MRSIQDCLAIGARLLMNVSFAEQLAMSVSAILTVYIAIGVVVAAFLHIRALAVIDPSAKGSEFLFRVVITPGLVALWPMVPLKLWNKQSDFAPEPFAPRRLRALQGLLVILAAILLPIALGAALYTRPLSIDSVSTNERLEP